MSLFEQPGQGRNALRLTSGLQCTTHVVPLLLSECSQATVGLRGTGGCANPMGHAGVEGMSKITRRLCIWPLFAVLCLPLTASAQDMNVSSAAADGAKQSNRAEPVLHVTLQEAIERAKKLSPVLATALTNARIAAEATLRARAANLPNVTGTSQYLYTEGNGTPYSRFIANNGVHEYIAQTDVHQAISAPLLIQYRRSAVLQAVAKDQATIAKRGLAVTVVQA